jgi:membrane protein DedA with SNARE-associated domain
VDGLVGEDWPFVLVWLFFLFGATARGGTLHWVGRRARRLRLGRRPAGSPAGTEDPDGDATTGPARTATAGPAGTSPDPRPAVARAERLVARWGAPAVTLSFLTVGLQSAVNVASGLLRMPLRRFVPALLLGAAIWATIYTTVGMAVVYAFLGRLDPAWVVAGAVALVVALAGGTWLRRRVEAQARSTQANGTRSTERSDSRRW